MAPTAGAYASPCASCRDPRQGRSCPSPGRRSATTVGFLRRGSTNRTNAWVCPNNRSGLRLAGTGPLPDGEEASMQFCPKCGARSQTQARSAPSAAPHFRRPPNPRDSVRACPRSGPDQRQPAAVARAHTMGSGAKALLVAGIAPSLAVFGGAATLVRHRTGHGQPHPKHLAGRRCNHERTNPPPRQPMPAPQPAAALPRPSRRSTARSPAGSRASRPPHETAAASATGSSCPNLVATVAHVVEGALRS